MLLNVYLEILEPTKNPAIFNDHSLVEERSSFDAYPNEWLLFFTKNEGFIEEDDALYYKTNLKDALPRIEERLNYIKDNKLAKEIEVNVRYLEKTIKWLKKLSPETTLKLYFGHYGDIVDTERFRTTSSITKLEEKLNKTEIEVYDCVKICNVDDKEKLGIVKQLNNSDILYHYNVIKTDGTQSSYKKEELTPISEEEVIKEIKENYSQKIKIGSFVLNLSELEKGVAEVYEINENDEYPIFIDWKHTEYNDSETFGNYRANQLLVVPQKMKYCFKSIFGTEGRFK